MSDWNLTEGMPEPQYIIRGNRVRCKFCGATFKTRAKYVAHFSKRHLNEDGTWRTADKNFRMNNPTPEELEVAELDDRNRRRNKKPWWEL